MNHLTGTKLVKIKPGAMFRHEHSQGETVDLAEPIADFIVNFLKSGEYTETEEVQAFDWFWPVLIICGILILLLIFN